LRKISFGMAITADPDRAPDPKTLRALAHPLRWKLIDLLGSETTATATRCAEVLGESEASCSYHLRILAKYGYITRAANPESREKPWQLTRPDQNLFPADPDAGTALAAEAAVEVFLDHEIAKLKSRLRRKSLEPPQWQQATRLQGTSTWLTADELRQVSDQLDEITSRYLDRLSDPARRPPGCREVRLFTAATVAPPTAPAPPAAPAQPAAPARPAAPAP
jgi:DNA-binding MarR family transcriptional regulator